MGCVDLLSVTAVSLLSGPVTGGVETVITVAGVLAESTFNASFVADLSSSTVCQPIGNNQFTCIIPATATPTAATVSIRVSTSRPWISSAFAFQYVSVAEQFGADLNSSAAYASPSVTASSTGTPGIPQTRTAEVNSRTSTLVITVAVVLFCLIAVVVVASMLCGESRHCREALDRLAEVDGLKFIAEDETGKPTLNGYVMRRQGSRISGLITIIVVMVALTGVSALAIQYALDNTAIDNSLQPVDDPPTAFASSYAATLLSSGSTLCATNSSCAPGLSISVTGFTTLRPTAGDGVQCSVTQQGCRVDYRCGACTVASTSPSMTVSDPSPNAYALSYSFSVSSVDYFGQPSIASGSISAAVGSVLKGSGNPAAASVTLTPATFSNFGTVTSGVLAKAVGTAPGSELSLQEFGVSGGVAFTIQITANQNARSIELSQKTSAVSAVAQAAGLVSGSVTIGTLAVILIFTVRNRTRKNSSPSGAAEMSPSPAVDNPV